MKGDIMKLVKLQYMTLKGKKKINSYNLNISKKIVEQAGIDDSKELVAIAKNKEIIIREK